MFIISFLRKKQTIIYIIIVALIWSLWPISDILSTIKKDVINKQNKDAYIEKCSINEKSYFSYIDDFISGRFGALYNGIQTINSML